MSPATPSTRPNGNDEFDVAAGAPVNGLNVGALSDVDSVDGVPVDATAADDGCVVRCCAGDLG